MGWLNTLSRVWNVMQSPKVAIDCFGGSEAQRICSYFNSRHPKLPIFRRKTLGAALREVPGTKAEIDSGSDFSQHRRKVRKAVKAGYRFAGIDPLQHFDDVMRINLSTRVRQGGELPADYVDPTVVEDEMHRGGDWFGVFSAQGRLEAYAFVPVFGDAGVFWKILGHADALDDGVMYLLVDGTLRELVERRERGEGPRWIMYDMYIGGGDGLREFKRRTGFRPYRVRWRWRPEAERA